MLNHGSDPRTICQELGVQVPDALEPVQLFRILQALIYRMGKRERKARYEVDEIVEMIQHAKKIIVLTGAGISVSCGIPDFRSKDGLYAKLAVDFPELPDPQVPTLFRRLFLTNIYRACFAWISSKEIRGLFFGLQKRSSQEISLRRPLTGSSPSWKKGENFFGIILKI